MIRVPRLPQAWAAREVLLRMATRLVAEERVTCPLCFGALEVTEATTLDKDGHEHDTIIATCTGCEYVLEIGREVLV